MQHHACKSIRIQLAEDHEVVRSGFRHLLNSEDDMEVVAESANGVQARRDYDEYKPDVLVMDISMPGMNGLDVARQILNRHSEARILILSMHSGMVVDAALQQGIRGFISKQCGVRDLTVAIRKIMQGERYLDHESADQLTLGKRKTGKALLSFLTKRELEVCMLLTDGQSVSNIAEQLHLSKKTVYTHREHILYKLGVRSIAALTLLTSFFDNYMNSQF